MCKLSDLLRRRTGHEAWQRTLSFAFLCRETPRQTLLLSTARYFFLCFRALLVLMLNVHFQGAHLCLSQERATCNVEHSCSGINKRFWSCADSLQDSHFIHDPRCVKLHLLCGWDILGTTQWSARYGWCSAQNAAISLATPCVIQVWCEAGPSAKA